MSQPTPPDVSRFVIADMIAWRHEVSKMHDAQTLNNGLNLFKLARTRDGIMPFTGDALQHAKNILHKRAKSLSVYWLSSASQYRDTPAHLLGQDPKQP